MKKLKRLQSYGICILLVVCTFCDLKAQGFESLDIAPITTGGFIDSSGYTSAYVKRYDIPFIDGDFNLKPLITINGDSSEVMFYGAELLTVNLLLKYEIECYNDSSEVVTHECPDNMPGCLVYHTWIKTVHKEPTFSDFVRWVRKKYCN